MSNTTVGITDGDLKPQEVLNQLNIIDVQIKTFGGYMTRNDEVFRDGEEVIFTKGSIKVIDPAHVTCFSSSRTLSKRICSAVGVSLAGGYAVSDESTKEIIPKLIAAREKFYREKKLFLQNYGAYIEEQANQKPEHYAMVKGRAPSKEYVDGQLQFEIRVYKMVAAEIDGVDNLVHNEVGDLKWQLAKEIAQDIKASWKGTSGTDSADQRTIGMLRRIHDKLQSLVFLDKRIGEVQNFVAEAIKLLPSGSRITGREYLFLVGVIETLSDPKKLLNDALSLGGLQVQEKEDVGEFFTDNQTIVKTKKAKPVAVKRAVVPPPSTSPSVSMGGDFFSF